MSQKPIRILQVGMSDNYGGTEAIIYGIYEHLDHSKIQFDFLNVYGHPIARQDKLIAQGAHVYDLLLKRREGYAKYIRGIKEFYKQHAKEFDAVVCNVQCLDQIDMAKYAKKFGIKKTVVHVHNSGNGIEASRLADLAIRMNKAHCHRYVDLFLACSKNAAKWGFSSKDAAKAIVVKNGLQISDFQFDPKARDQFRTSLKVPFGAPLYGSAGRLDPQKNQEFLLRIYQQIHLADPSAHFVLLGHGPLEAELKKEIGDLDITSCCHLISRADQMKTFYSGIDEFVFPSRFEGLGMVLLEAQCAGLPCLASQDTIPPEVQISPLLHFVPLSLSAKEWAQQAMTLVRGADRTNGPLYVQKDDRDIRQTAQMYEGLFL